MVGSDCGYGLHLTRSGTTGVGSGGVRIARPSFLGPLRNRISIFYATRQGCGIDSPRIRSSKVCLRLIKWLLLSGLIMTSAANGFEL